MSCIHRIYNNIVGPEVEDKEERENYSNMQKLNKVVGQWHKVTSKVIKTKEKGWTTTIFPIRIQTMRMVKSSSK